VSNVLSHVAVIIPALNEAESLPLVLANLPEVGQVFVVDNGSTDKTAEVARAGGATVIHEPQRGYGSACLAGIAAADMPGIDIVVILDGDHTFDPQEMHLLVEPIDSDEADMVLGDRTVKAEPGALTLPQRFGNKVATRLIHLISGFQYHDMGPFRAIRRAALMDMGMSDPNYGWNVEMQIKAIRLGYRVKEVPVTCRNRAAGTSKISGSVTGALKCGAKMMLATARYAQ
jgi:glycosyltransferase involved in cell wall biosynthesis